MLDQLQIGCRIFRKAGVIVTVAVVPQLLAIGIDARNAVDEWLQRSYHSPQLLIADIRSMQPFPVYPDVVIPLDPIILQQAGFEQTISRELQRQLDRVPRVVEDGQHKRVAFREQFLLDDRIDQLDRGLDIAVELVLLVSLAAETGIPVAIKNTPEKWIIGVRIGFDHVNAALKAYQPVRTWVVKRDLQDHFLGPTKHCALG
ncbi:hypothetical protein [Bradyrhizobium icense]|uniref:Uncharacterized protein n=1 Tax=Bradyrhizobium icense TaxID=1274631 RepID=A0A1B1UBF2_9BRAD|nr:hypothetical protein [Bradyrhizobium icense]ANW00092.1 hypothetical protein LMTR13_07740 [Bradyrhizobium icense]